MAGNQSFSSCFLFSGLNLNAETLEKLKELINGQDGVSS